MAHRRRFGGANTGTESRTNVQVSNESIDDTSCTVKVLCKRTAVCLLFLYFSVPLLLYAFPQIVEQVVFMNLNYKRDEATSLSRPFSEYGLHGVANFRISCDGEQLGVWHILPSGKISSYKDDSAVELPAIETLLKDAKDIVIYHHGNGMSRATGEGHHRSQLYEVLQNQGFHVLAFDYRGFGDSTGWPSEKGLVNDSLCILRWTRKRVSPSAKVSFWGHSLGAAIATISSRTMFDKCIEDLQTCSSISNLIIEGGYTDIKQAAEESFPAQLFNMVYPISLFRAILSTALEAKGIEMAVANSMAKIQCPVLILHSEDDMDILCKHSDELFKICKETKSLRKAIKYVKFKAHHKYRHVGIVKAPELPDIVQKFLSQSDSTVEALLL